MRESDVSETNGPLNLELYATDVEIFKMNYYLNLNFGFLIVLNWYDYPLSTGTNIFVYSIETLYVRRTMSSLAWERL